MSLLCSRHAHHAAYGLMHTLVLVAVSASQLQAYTCFPAQTTMALLRAAFCAFCHKLGRDIAWRLRDSTCSHPYHLERCRIMQLLVLDQYAADWLVGRVGGPCVGHLPEHVV